MLPLLLCLLCMASGVLSVCHPYFGPPGGVVCIAAPQYYNQYQWATCLTDMYIKVKSGHRHQCISRSRTYCYYQCMLESFEKSSGTVNSQCSCRPGDRKPHQNIQSSACLSPSGESCNWYRDCLEKKKSCQDTTNGYAIRYSERFCKMYDRNKLWFSSKAQRWIHAVRKCLQVTLVPLLRPWRSPSCLEIRREALQSHTKCYINPDANIPSVCDLSCVEFYKIFYAIKAGYFGRLDTAWESFKSLWNIQDRCGSKCTRDWFTPQNNTIIRMMKMGIEKVKSRPHKTSLPESDMNNRFADQVVTFISKSLRWNSAIMDWMAYPGSTSASLFVVLADKKALGIVQTSNPPVNFNDTITEFALAIANSSIPVQVDGTNVWLKSLESCSDKTCSQPRSLVISLKPPTFPVQSTTEKPSTTKKPSTTGKPSNTGKISTADNQSVESTTEKPSTREEKPSPKGIKSNGGKVEKGLLLGIGCLSIITLWMQG
ncbi:uncharacterized protein LOC110243318 [Exaiptasia diaphana]|uniref:Uncharacterized protein n=1 Tax=Exaiptasia diaphana TaxID=2652724 RepID=A0A913XIS9_EXADI|nr:uncharacterized protein LOC110243318 [Exaiptasia diaphana]KXJ11698.1 hypothetical protein AC249_AIPGENE10743 [Exaiptasia diaphana]